MEVPNKQIISWLKINCFPESFIVSLYISIRENHNNHNWYLKRQLVLFNLRAICHINNTELIGG